MERFEEFKVFDLIQDEQKVLAVTENATVEDVIRILSTNHIHSVPVTDSLSNDLLGFVDYLDVLAFLLDDIAKQSVSSGGSFSETVRTDDLNQLMKRASRFKAANIISASLCNRGASNPTVVIGKEASVKDALELLGQGVHRLGVSSGSYIIAMLTQSSVLAWLMARPERLAGLRSKTARELGWTREKKGTTMIVKSDEIVIDALMAVRRSFHASLPVVAHDGTFVGVLSSTDVKMLKESNFSLSLKDVQSFLQDVRAAAHAATRNYRVTCTADATLDEITKKMSQERVSTIAVVDSNGKLDTVVTLTDIVKAMLVMPYTAIQ